MPEKLEKSFDYFRKMSSLKKALIAFVFLLIFIIIVEQPGSYESKKEKSSRFFIPKLVIEEVQEVSISNPLYPGEQVSLKKESGQWRVANGRSFPADADMVEDFLLLLHGLKEVEMVSNNPDRTGLFGVDEAAGTTIEITDENGRLVSSFYAGKTPLPNRQFLRKSDSSEVLQVNQDLTSYLNKNKSDWKDKTLLRVNEKEALRITLSAPDEKLVLAKGEGGWLIAGEQELVPQPLAIRTLFDQLKKVRADSFAEAVDASQVDFEEPDYQISVLFTDDRLSLVIFKQADDETHYYAKNPEKAVVYSVSNGLIDNIFGLDFQ